MTIRELIERLEKATGPDREIDEAIYIMLGKAPEIGGYYGWRRDGAGYWSRPTDSEGRNSEVIFAPLYTNSIDAALTLVPEGMGFKIETRSNYVCCEVFRYRWGLTGGKYDVCFSEEGGRFRDPSPAIALCIAALKAREAQG